MSQTEVTHTPSEAELARDEAELPRDEAEPEVEKELGAEPEVTPEMYMAHRITLTRDLIEKLRTAIGRTQIISPEVITIARDCHFALTAPYPEQIPKLFVSSAKRALSTYVGPLQSIIESCDKIETGLRAWSEIEPISKDEPLPDLESVTQALESVNFLGDMLESTTLEADE